MEFSYKITLQKGVKYFVVFALPFLVDQFILVMPDIANLTIGACLLMLVNMLKVKYGLRVP
jgi:hypothetical protein